MMILNNKKLTIKEVAEYAEVSQATVSRVLNDYKWVSPEVKNKVNRAIQELNYVPDFNAKTMVKGKSHMVVVIVPVIDNHFFTQLINTIISELKINNYYTVIYTTESAEEELDFLNSSFCQMADGILDATSLEDIRLLYNIRKPLVLIDRFFSNNFKIDCVTSDNFKAMYRATKYLIEKGHQRVGYITGIEGHGIFQERYRGFKAAFEDSGIIFPEEYYIKDVWKIDAGVRGCNKLLEMSNPPTAIIAGNNLLTYGVLEELERRKSNVSIIGFEECDEDIRTFSRKEITCLQMNTEKIGKEAVSMLMNRINNEVIRENANRVKSFELIFKERKSVLDVTRY
ncbi:MAG: LacI family DNA-binding transcriptional regulator [Eubacteriales bacterium]|nr:LacI family DNA-binding transcriptional regulator [Eubacteriales bacterium]